MLVVEGVSATFVEQRRRLAVLRDISLSLGRNEFVAIVGPSGSGKTLSLQMIAGLVQPDRGQIRLGEAARGVVRAGAAALLAGLQVERIPQPHQRADVVREGQPRGRRGAVPGERRRLVRHRLALRRGRRLPRGLSGRAARAKTAAYGVSAKQ